MLSRSFASGACLPGALQCGSNTAVRRSPFLPLLLALLALTTSLAAADTALPAWLRARGASISPVSVGSGPAFTGTDATFSRPGLWADAPLAPGDVIATIPSSLLLYFDSSFAPSSAVSLAATVSAAAAAAASAAWSPAPESPAGHMSALLASLHATNMSDPYALLSARVLYEQTRAGAGEDVSDLFAPHSPYPVNTHLSTSPSSSSSSTGAAAAAGRVNWPASGRVSLSPSALASLHLSPAAAASSPLPSVAAEHAALAARMAAVLAGLVTPDLSNKVIASLRDPAHAAAAAAAAGADASAAADAAALAKLTPITETPFARALPHGPAGLSAEAFAAAYAQTLASALFVPVRGTDPSVPAPAKGDGEGEEDAKASKGVDGSSKGGVGQWTVALAPLLTVINHQTTVSSDDLAADENRLGIAPETADALGVSTQSRSAKGVAAAPAAAKGPSAAIRLRLRPHSLAAAAAAAAAAGAGGVKEQGVKGDFVLELVALRSIPAHGQITLDLGQLLHDPPSAAAVASLASTAPLTQGKGVGAGVILPLPASPTPNAVLLLHFNSALLVNPYEGVLLEVQTEAPALPPLPSDAPPQAATAAASAAADAVARTELLKRLLAQNTLPTAASLTVAAPIRSQPSFHQALRAAQLSLRELKELDKHIGLRFEAGKGFFSLHNELAALLGAFGAMDEIAATTTAPPTEIATTPSTAAPASAAAASAAAAAAGSEGSKKGEPLKEAREWVALIKAHHGMFNLTDLLPHPSPVTIASTTTPTSANSVVTLPALNERGLLWAGLRSAYRSATARAVHAVALDALAGVLDVFADLSRRWERDAAAVEADKDAPRGVKESAKRWRRDIGVWEKEAKKWAGTHRKWVEELLSADEP